MILLHEGGKSGWGRQNDSFKELPAGWQETELAVVLAAALAQFSGR